MALDFSKWPTLPLPVKPTLGGKFLVFEQSGTSMGEPRYTIRSRRGGFVMGGIEFRNQWQDWSFKADGEAVFNKECVAEIYTMLKRPSVVAGRRAKWRAALRDWLLRWL